MNKYIFDRGYKRKLEGKILAYRRILSFIICMYIMIASQIYPEPILHRSISFGLFFSYLFISYGSPGVKKTNRIVGYDLIFSMMSIIVSVYVGLNIDRIISRNMFYDQVYVLDIIFFFITVLLIVEGGRRIIGPWLPLLSILSLLYIFFGNNITGRFGHQGFSLEYIVDGLFLTSYGIWGSIIGTAAGHVMVFLIFGAFFLKSGAGDFLYDLAASIAGKTRGGIAKVAVISSAMFGMISGGPITNVSTTGNLTIPAMIKRGYSKEFSAATESCASIGGTFMPPVMGSVVFIMSEVVGIPYGEIAKRAFIPAVIYFCAIFFVIDARSKKLGLKGIVVNEENNFFSLVFRGANFFIPLGYLIFRIMSGISPSKSGIETIFIIIATSIIRNKSLLKINIILDCFDSAVSRGVTILSTMITCGILVGVIYITGITAKFSSYLMSISDVSIIFTLFVMMGITIFLGLAMNSLSAYLITAVICAPVVIMQGYEPLSVHMFILYYAATASITPPVAMTSFIAATIADTSPLKVSFLSMRMAVTAYLLPYGFIFYPELLLYGSNFSIIIISFMALLAAFIASNLTEGFTKISFNKIKYILGVKK